MGLFDGDIQKKALTKLKAQVDTLTPEQQKAALDYYGANIDRWTEEYAANAKKRSVLEQKVIDFVKQDPIKAVEVVKDPVPQVIDQLVTLNEETNPYMQGLKESSQPIWERDSTVKILGQDGADKLQDALNPARWGENAINDLGVSDTTKKSLKKYLPVALAGGAALLILSALK